MLSVVFNPYAPIIATNRNIFRKISLQGNEIEIFEEQDDSYFDKYLNEVLYLGSAPQPRQDKQQKHKAKQSESGPQG